MSPLLRRILIALIAVALIAAAIGWFTRPKPIPVRLHAVAAGTVEATLANTRAGTIEACQRTKLSTIMGGRIEYLGVKEGDRVKQGQLLLKLWNDDQQAQRTLALAQREQARQRISEACTLATNAAREAEGSSPFRALVEGYLSERHLSGAENGCAVAALVSEMPRQSPDVRAAAAARVRGLVAVVEKALPEGAAPGLAAAIASQMVGALQLARTLGDNAEGQSLLADNRRLLLAQHDRSSSSSA